MIKPHLNTNKKQQRVQFQQVVLYWSVCQQQAMNDQTRSKHQQKTTASTAPAGCSVLECLSRKKAMIKPHLNTNKKQQRVQFQQVVLYWSACQQQVMIKPHLNTNNTQLQVQLQQVVLYWSACQQQAIDQSRSKHQQKTSARKAPAGCSVLECLSAAGDDQTRSKHQQHTATSTAPAGCSVLECLSAAGNDRTSSEHQQCQHYRYSANIYLLYNVALVTVMPSYLSKLLIHQIILNLNWTGVLY